MSYSPDGGVTYVPLTMMVTNTEFLWLTHLAPASAQGFIKVEASDGFHVGTAIAGPFTVDPKPPLASIISPAAGARLVQSAGVTLAGRAYEFGQGVIETETAYHWTSSRDGCWDRVVALKCAA